MFLIAIDNSGRLLVETSSDRAGNRKKVACLPLLARDFGVKEISAWASKIGITDISNPNFFKLLVDLGSKPVDYVSCQIEISKLVDSKYELKTLDSLWSHEIDRSLAVALNQILASIELAVSGSAARFEEMFLNNFNIKKENSRVFFAKSETVSVNESMISFLGAFAVNAGNQTARLCLHLSQLQPIQEMLMIHAAPIHTGPLRQNNDSSISYHMIRGALEITLQHGGSDGDQILRVEGKSGESGHNSLIRVPARVFRTIRTLTDSAVFIEVQSGPFTDSDTEWAKHVKKLRVLVLGSTGEIGQQLCVDLKILGHEVVAMSRSEDSKPGSTLRLDLTEIKSTIKTFEKLENFDIVIYLAGISKLVECEQDPTSSKLINVTAPKILCEYFLKNNCQKFIYLSSSRVFNGENPLASPTTEHNPLTEFGHQKSEAETLLLRMGPKVKIVRFSKVLASQNKLINNWISSLSKGEQIKAISNIAISPISLTDLSRVIANVVANDCPQVVQISASDEVTYYDVAIELAKLLGANESLVMKELAQDCGQIVVKHALLESTYFGDFHPPTSLSVVRHNFGNRIIQ